MQAVPSEVQDVPPERATARPIESLFASDVRTPTLKLHDETATEGTTGLASLTSVLLQNIGNHCNPVSFRAVCTTCRAMHNALAYTAPGLKAARTDGEVSLYPWQAINVNILLAFLQHAFHVRIARNKELTTEGMVLSDAPGGGKTVSTLATVVKTIPAAPTHPTRTCVIFAPKVIVPQWAAQIARHFAPAASGLHLYCATGQDHLYDASTRGLETRPDDAIGGVFLEQRPSAILPETRVLASFDIVVLAKEMLSLRTDLSGSCRKEKNDVEVKALKRHTRLVVIDESHNLSASGAISNQQLNVEAFAGVPKLLLSGTPGTAPRRLYDMLALVRHASWRGGGGYKSWLKARFDTSSAGRHHYVLPARDADVVAELNSCFLHTPAAVIFSQRAPVRLTRRVTPSEAEQVAYNYVLSLHQRDVIRAGPGKTQPAEWQQARLKTAAGGSLDWQQRRHGGESGSHREPSADKTLVELMCACNGGERWAVSTQAIGTTKDPMTGIKSTKYKPLPHAHPSYLDQLVTIEGKPVDMELPVCVECGIGVPGVLSTPCGSDADATLCPECFKEEAKTWDPRDLSGSKFTKWAKTQPFLEVRSAADFEYDGEQLVSTQIQAAMVRNREATILLRQPAARPFEKVEVAQRESLASKADDVLRGMTEGYAKVDELALYLKKLKYPLGAAGRPTHAKVLLVPPSHKDVRNTFIDSLRGVIGRDAIADLNDVPMGKGTSKLELATAIEKFRRGCGHYWQCECCGEVHEAATRVCDTATFRVKLEAPPQDAPHPNAPPRETLRFIHDVEKVDSAGQRDASQNKFIGNRVAVLAPGRRRALHDPFGTIEAKGSCNGKRPTARSAFIEAPPDSCFVLILNASGIEGLDLGEATHLIKTEPMARADKEQQAEARGRRLGGAADLKIVQMLMEGTVEEEQHAMYGEAREAAAAAAAAAAAGNGGDATGGASSSAETAVGGATAGKAGSSRGTKRPLHASEAESEAESEALAEVGRQAALLNRLMLLRHPSDEVAA